MSARGRGEAPPLFLTLVHLFVFGGAACVAVELAFPEWRQLWEVVASPYVLGAPPQLPPLVGSLVCAVLGVVLLVRVASRRTVPLPLSVAILIFAALSFWPAPPTGQRSWAAVDMAVLDTAQRVQRKMVQTLQSHGGVPTDAAAWQKALADAAREPLPVHAHLRPLSYTLHWAPWGPDLALPKGLAPGTVVARVSPDGAAFALNAVGFSREGRAAYLQDDRGETLTLRGLFNPSQAGSPGPFGAAGDPSGGF